MIKLIPLWMILFMVYRNKLVFLKKQNAHRGEEVKSLQSPKQNGKISPADRYGPKQNRRRSAINFQQNILPHSQKPTPGAGTDCPPNVPLLKRDTGLWGRLLLAYLIGCWLLGFTVEPLYAAVHINSFDVSVSDQQVILTWSTSEEYNLGGFEILYKEADQSVQAYQSLGIRIAQGSATQGVAYRMDLTAYLQPGKIYCFRIQEIPTDDSPGEKLDYCGYGFTITPTPSALATPLATATITPSVASGLNLPIAPTPPIEVTATVTETSSTPDNVAGVATMTPTPVVISPLQPTATSVNESPLATPSPTLTTTNGSTAAVNSASVAPLATDQPISPLMTQTANLQTNGATVASAEAAPTEATTPPLAIVDPPYIVVTATPTLAAIPLLPTFTAYPTATAQPEISLVGMRLPNTQNLMLLLLCGVFSGASGLGILGVVTTLLYMRSRSRPHDQNHRR